MNGLKEFMNITLSNLTCVVCLNTNRRFIGIELDETYFNIAKERIYATARDTESN
jgi:DNA modification methylase